MSAPNLPSVLYVDDDPDICQVVRTTLCLLGGLRVHTTGSGENAIDLAYKYRPDLILMDVMMPGLDGPSTFRRMRASPLISRIPVIFMTAKVMPQEIIGLLSLGAIGVIGKPFDPTQLCDQLFDLWKSVQAVSPTPSTPAERSRVQAEIDPLSESFLQRARDDAVRLRAMIERARRKEKMALEEIERCGHSLHGAGAMFGFPRVSALGGAIEQLAESILAEADGTHDNCVEPGRLDSLESFTRDLEAAAVDSPSDIGMFQVSFLGR